MSKKSNGLPQKALKLARRVAGLQKSGRLQVVHLDVVMLPDGEWHMSVDGSDKMERLGRS